MNNVERMNFCHIRGDEHYNGSNGVKKDDRKAFELWEEGGIMLHSQCMKNLIWAYENGIGCEPDKEMATYWTLQSVKMRQSQSCIRGLRSLIDDIDGGAMVEVGSFMGESASMFAESGKFDRIVCVDIWDADFYESSYKTVKHLRGKFDYGNIEKAFDMVMDAYEVIEKMKMSSEEAASKVEHVDVVYIDASHDYESVKKDIGLWLPKIRDGGWVCGHDYSKHWPGVCRAVDEFFPNNFKRYDDSSWAARV